MATLLCSLLILRSSKSLQIVLKSDRPTSSVIHFSAQTACPPVRRRRRRRRRRRGTRLCPSVRLFPNSCDRATADRRRRSRRRRRRAPPACPSPPVCLSSDRTGLHRASRRSPVEAAATTTDCAQTPAAPDRERLGVACWLATWQGTWNGRLHATHLSGGDDDGGGIDG